MCGSVAVSYTHLRYFSARNVLAGKSQHFLYRFIALYYPELMIDDNDPDVYKRQAEGSVRVYINGVLQTAPPTVTSLQPLVFSGLSLPANSNMTIIYEAVTTRFAPLSAAGTITNTATISGDGAGSPVTATATVTAKAEPDLTINKSIEPAVVTENGTVTYTFTIQNYGNTATAAADNVSVTDTFDPVLSNLSVAFNGTAWTEGTEYTYNAGTGLFTTVPGQITIPAATYAQDAETGIWSITPGTGILTVRGTL